MALNIKNAEVERLATEVAALTGESKTEAIRQALLARQKELTVEERMARMNARLEAEVWSKLPPEIRGKGLSKAEQEEILGIGPKGY
jgi:antitoxin VapB